eukprot:1311187-Prymnesium_polylepis.2
MPFLARKLDRKSSPQTKSTAAASSSRNAIKRKPPLSISSTSRLASWDVLSSNGATRFAEPSGGDLND